MWVGNTHDIDMSSNLMPEPVASKHGKGVLGSRVLARMLPLEEWFGSRRPGPDVLDSSFKSKFGKNGAFIGLWG